jgi:hypothetical protein
MKLARTLLLVCLAALAGVAGAAEPGVPDPAYCSQRDADPEKCVIQDGPPPPPIVHEKKPPSKPPVPPKPVEQAPAKDSTKRGPNPSSH